MPRVESDAAAGLVVPGVYQALLEHERARYERRGGEPVVIDGCEIGKKVPARLDEHGKETFFLYPRRGPLNSLEADETMNVSVGWLEDALWSRDRAQDPQAPRVRLPFGRGVRRLSVSSDDRVVPFLVPMG
jgi:hypothetical protein